MLVNKEWKSERSEFAIMPISQFAKHACPLVKQRVLARGRTVSGEGRPGSLSSLRSGCAIQQNSFDWVSNFDDFQQVSSARIDVHVAAIVIQMRLSRYAQQEFACVFAIYGLRTRVSGRYPLAAEME